MNADRIYIKILIRLIRKSKELFFDNINIEKLNSNSCYNICGSLERAGESSFHLVPIIKPLLLTTARIYAHSAPENKMKAVEEASKKWTMRHRDWAMIYSQLMILFEDRVAKYV